MKNAPMEKSTLIQKSGNLTILVVSIQSNDQQLSEAGCQG